MMVNRSKNTPFVLSEVEGSQIILVTTQEPGNQDIFYCSSASSASFASFAVI